MRSYSAVILFLPLFLGCGSKEDATLSVYTQNTTLSKTNGSAFPALGGSVDLVLDLGSFSSGSVTVDGAAMRLYQGNTTINVLARATFTVTDGTTFPVTVNAGQKKSIHYDIKIDQLTTDEQTQLCATPIAVGGTVSQSGNGTQVKIGSTPVTASGC